jgi:hypothetical protein
MTDDGGHVVPTSCSAMAGMAVALMMPIFIITQWLSMCGVVTVT